jgi:hypothetical protein
VGAWTSGPSGLLGALGVGGLVGLLVIRGPEGVSQPWDIAVATLLVVGPWFAGVVTHGLRRRHAEREPWGEPWDVGGREPSPAGEPNADDEAVETSIDSGALEGQVAREILAVGSRAMADVAAASRGALDGADDPGRVSDVLAGIEATSRGALAEMRRLASLLPSPQGADALAPRPGLGDLEYLVDRVSEAGLPVDLRIEGIPIALAEGVDQVAFAVVQEALRNALVHAGSARASVVVRYAADGLELEIEDDGRGRDADEADEETRSLEAIGDRVALYGGVLEAAPRGRGGYSVNARLPVVG